MQSRCMSSQAFPTRRTLGRGLHDPPACSAQKPVRRHHLRHCFMRGRHMHADAHVFRPVRLCVTLWTAAHQAPLSMGFSRQESWSGCHALLQGRSPTQRSNTYLRQRRADYSPPSHLGSLCLLRALHVSNRFKWKSPDVPGGPVVEDPPYNAGNADLIPGATGELSPCAPTAEPMCRAGALRRSVTMRRPRAETGEGPPIMTGELSALTARKVSPLFTTGKRPRMVVKTQCSQG